MEIPGQSISRSVAGRRVLSRNPDIAGLLARDGNDGFDALRASERTGKPRGNADFIAGLGRILGRRIANRASGLKPGSADDRQGVLSQTAKAMTGKCISCHAITAQPLFGLPVQLRRLRAHDER